MEIVNKNERIKSLIKWSLINLILIGAVSFILWSKFEKYRPCDDAIKAQELKYDSLRLAYEALVYFNELKDSFLLSYSTDTSITISQNMLRNLHSLYDDWSKQSIAIEGDGMLHVDSKNVVLFKIFDAVVDLKSMAYITPKSIPKSDGKNQVIIDYTKFNKLRTRISNDVNIVIRQIEGLIKRDEKKKDQQSVENVKGLTIIRDNILNDLRSWMQ